MIIPIDFSLDVNREALRQKVRGAEKSVAIAFDHLTPEYATQVGMGQYTHIGFTDWLCENYPDYVNNWLESE